MDNPASGKRGGYTGVKAAKNTSSLLSRLILFVQMAKRQNREVTTADFRASEGDVSAEKTITLAVKRKWITLKRRGNAQVIGLGENVKEVETMLHMLGNDPDALK